MTMDEHTQTIMNVINRAAECCKKVVKAVQKEVCYNFRISGSRRAKQLDSKTHGNQ